MTSSHTRPCLILETPRSRGGHGYVVVTSTDAPDQDDIFEALRAFKSDGDRSPYLGVSRKVVNIERSGTSRTGDETLLILPPSGAVWNETDKIEIRSALSQLLKKEIDLLITGEGVGQDGENSILYRDPRLNRFADELNGFFFLDDDYQVDHIQLKESAQRHEFNDSLSTNVRKNKSQWIFIGLAFMMILSVFFFIRYHNGLNPTDNEIQKIPRDEQPTSEENDLEIHQAVFDDDAALLKILDILRSDRNMSDMIYQSSDLFKQTSLNSKSWSELDHEWIIKEARKKNIKYHSMSELFNEIGKTNRNDYDERFYELIDLLKTNIPEE